MGLHTGEAEEPDGNYFGGSLAMHWSTLILARDLGATHIVTSSLTAIASLEALQKLASAPQPARKH